MSGSAPSPTLRDLVREAGGPVPVMLAVTVLVQVLGALTRRRRHGVATGELSLDDLVLTGAPPRALLDDPSRDPRVRIAVSEDKAVGAAPARLHGADGVFRELVAGPESPPAAARLLRRLERADLEQALAEARKLGLDLLTAWDRRRGSVAMLDGGDNASRRACDEVEARRRLAAALDAGSRREVLRHGRELARILGVAGGADGDLTVARGWLEEREELRSRRRQVSLKLALTGAPLILATLLTGLLGVVMLFSG